MGSSSNPPTSPSPGHGPGQGPPPIRPVRASYNSYYSDKPLPNPSPERPGTSGTEAELEAQLRRMAEDLRQAQLAKRLYRARKTTATQRANRSEAKAHFSSSVQHFGMGVRLSWAVFTGIPVYLREKHKLRGERRGDDGDGDDQVKTKKRFGLGGNRGGDAATIMTTTTTTNAAGAGAGAGTAGTVGTAGVVPGRRRSSTNKRGKFAGGGGGGKDEVVPRESRDEGKPPPPLGKELKSL